MKRKPKITPPLMFPPLAFGIYRDGELIRVATTADPRNTIMLTYNEFGTETTAGPLTSDLPLPDLQIGIFAQDGRLIRTDTMPDPRNSFCEAFNALQTDSRHAGPLPCDPFRDEPDEAIDGEPGLFQFAMFQEQTGKLIDVTDPTCRHLCQQTFEMTARRLAWAIKVMSNYRPPGVLIGVRVLRKDGMKGGCEYEDS